jgi:nucleoside-diphosphate-sugar epimerase
MDDFASDPLSEFCKVNVEGTANLAQQAADAGVKRFIFISSIKVNGESTETGQRFTPDDLPAPADAYGISKHEAEVRLRSVAQNSNMQIVIIRPALVYGPQVRANFLSMMRWINTGMPLPLGAIHNQRTLTGLGNLVDLIVTCARHPAAANQVFLAADDEDLSTTDLLRRTGAALGRRARLFPIPAAMIQLGAALIGRRHIAMRLCENLQVDISKTKTLLSWKPPLSLDEGLRLTAAAYLKSRKPVS